MLKNRSLALTAGARLLIIAPLMSGMLGTGLFPVAAEGHGITPPSLKGVRVPKTPGLLDGSDPVIVDQQAAIQLGKALFWDVNVGSDGVACASCHFHAGADRRVRNQLTTGEFHQDSPTATTFEAMASGAGGGPDYTLRKDDFPLHQLANPKDKNSRVLYTTDDVVSSSGAFSQRFEAVTREGGGHDRCQPGKDPIFHIGDLNTRRVEPRNTPTVFNAAFNFRNFWDGRANNIFNGASPFGVRDGNAGVWIVQEDGSVRRKRMRLLNSALASQATAPPVSETEMSCAERTFPEIGRKLSRRRPLELQAVHPDDSVLGELRHPSGRGLDTTYRALMKRSFAKRYWSGAGEFGAGARYPQLEANFSFFFGLALQLYQQTLISDETPFDSPRNIRGVPQDLNARQARGLQVFLDAHCSLCHKGPTLSAAAHPDVYSAPSATGLLLVNRKTLKGATTGSGVAFGLMDEGFANTSVTPFDHDPGIGGTDPFGNPLSYAGQYLQFLLGKATGMVDPVSIKSCSWDTPYAFDFSAKELLDDPFGGDGCGERRVYSKTPKPAVLRAELSKPGQGRALAATDGAFKIPSLRNVELTGPYMHNGGMKTLEEVVDFYDRGGNFDNPAHFGTLVFSQGLNPAQKTDLVAFLKSLTDERVRWERAPFDHPQISVPNGHIGGPSPQSAELAKDRLLFVPAVGKQGRDRKHGPLQPFERFLEP